MFDKLPKTPEALFNWTWDAVAPFYADLKARPLDASNVEGWLKDWSSLDEALSELSSRLAVATTVDTADKGAEERLNAFLDSMYPPSQAAEQELKSKFLASGLEPEGFAIPLRNMRAEAELFREENLPLQAEEAKLSVEYDKIVGAQTVTWEGEEVPLPKLRPEFQSQDRSRREAAWRAMTARQMADREAINALWARFLKLRLQLAENAGYGRDYRAYRWKSMMRFDYTPDDAKRFDAAIEEVVVPAAGRLLEKRRKALGVDALRPWDLNVDVLGREPLRPYKTVEEMKQMASGVFHSVDPQLGAYFETMRNEGLLDLESRKNKAPGGYTTVFAVAKRPFIFMNAAGLHDDVQTLLHEGGHSFHVFESAGLPYIHQQAVPMEFAEVASMGMELLGAPYLAASRGGFYTEVDAARAQAEHVEELITFWPYMAVVDSFQHWVYGNPDAAMDGAACDDEWARLWKRFMPDVDWSGLEPEMAAGWRRKLHIHQIPFYYIEYGLAQVGAMQVWRNSFQDPEGAVRQYRHALSLGGTVTLPEVFAAAGARFSSDAGTLRELVSLAEENLAKLGD